MDKPFAAYKGDDSYVFVCYAHDDEEVIYPEIAWLDEHGLNLWYDEGISGGKIWREEIGNAIKNASSVLYYVSNSSLTSQHCSREINFALDQDKDVVPVYLEDVALTTDLEVGLSRIQALHRERDANYRQHLLNALGQSTEAQPSPIAPTEPDDARIPPTSAPLTAIAVLPFDDLSPDGDQTWLANGMAEALIESLSRIEELRIPGRTSTSSLKQQGTTIQSIGEQLGVGTVVEGSVRRVGDRLTVVAQWIRVANESHLWSARYERAFEDVFDVQNEIAKGISEVIRTELGIKDAYGFMMQTRYQPADARAWEYFRRAYDLLTTFDDTKLPAVADFCRKAIEIDPMYAPGHSCLGFTYWRRGSHTDRARAIELAEHALELDPLDGSAIWILGMHSLHNWEFASVEALLTRAIEANPIDINVRIVYETLLRSKGRHQEALEEARRMAILEPEAAEIQAILARSLLGVGDHEAAVEKYQYAISLGPITPVHYLEMAVAHYLAGNAEAIDAMVRWAKTVPEAEIRGAYDETGWEGMNLYLAENLTTNSMAFAHGTPCWATHLAFAGATERMYECLEQGLAASAPWLPATLNSKVTFAQFWDEPRFQDLRRRFNDRIQSKSNVDRNNYEDRSRDNL